MSDVLTSQWPPDYSPVPPKAVTKYHLLDDAGLAELNYLKAAHKLLVMHLGRRYREGDLAEVARLCDYELDQSGRLLGEVRDYARL